MVNSILVSVGLLLVSATPKVAGYIFASFGSSSAKANTRICTRAVVLAKAVARQEKKPGCSVREQEYGGRSAMYSVIGAYNSVQKGAAAAVK